MIFLMWYLLIGVFWAVICKMTGAASVTISGKEKDGLLIQILLAVAIILFWVPIIFKGFFGGGKR